MKIEEYTSLDGLSLAKLVKSGEVSSFELAELAFKASQKVNPTINAIIELYEEQKYINYKPELKMPFLGVPMLLKDLSVTELGRRQESGSELLKNNTASENSELVNRFKGAGFNIIGRTSTPEFGWSASTESRLTGKTSNPWNLERSAGGSSGGSSAAVISGIVPVAHASDGSGSIRNPAGWCGLVGLKTSRGRISSSPSLGMSLGCRAVNFVVSRTLRDTAATLDSVHGNVPGDPFTISSPKKNYVDEMKCFPKNLVIAASKEPWGNYKVSSEVQKAYERTINLLVDLGHKVIEKRPKLSWDVMVNAILNTAAAGIVYNIDQAEKKMKRKASSKNLQATVLAVYEYGKKLSVLEIMDAIVNLDKITRNTAPFFEDVNVFMTPTSTEMAPPHGRHNSEMNLLDPREWSDIIHAEDAFLLLANVTGQPAISLPLETSLCGMPIGMHFTAKFGDEATLFRLGSQLESAIPWKNRRPPTHAGSSNNVKK